MGRSRKPRKQGTKKIYYFFIEFFCSSILRVNNNNFARYANTFYLWGLRELRNVYMSMILEALSMVNVMTLLSPHFFSPSVKGFGFERLIQRKSFEVLYN